MNKQEMERLLKEELERIPRGPAGSGQNELRMAYKTLRQHCLSQDSTQPPNEPFRQAVEQVRKNNPGFRPNLPDPEYFERGNK